MVPTRDLPSERKPVRFGLWLVEASALRTRLPRLIGLGLAIAFSLPFTFACLAVEPDVARQGAARQGAVVSFVNDVVPLFTKSGCNAGVCHAKAGNGQNGFQLSLLGFEPGEDYEHVVKEGRGRRVFPAAPENSLLLRKASGATPHGGGARLNTDSDGYLLLKRWIEQGVPFDGDAAARLVQLVVSNEEIPLATESSTASRSSSLSIVPRNSQRQLRAVAHYSDGSERDVTSMALYESNDKAMAEVSDQGLVRIFDIPGKVSIMVRFQGKVAVFSASVPLGAPIENLMTPKNFVDSHVFANLKELGIPPSDICDDETFIRRVSLDIAGRMPTVEETRNFLADQGVDRRGKVIDALLRGPHYADYFANKWTALLKNRRDDASDITSNFAFYSWLRDSFLANKPYDQLVRELLAATGTVIANPPVAWYKRVKEPKQQLEDVAQLFLGVRMQCAQCHHHPFERWSQDDYYSFEAFFSQVGRKPTSTRGEDMIFHKRGLAGAKNIKTGATLKPAALGDSVGDIQPDTDPRLKLADWMGSVNNPYFARALVNRYWKHFLRRGLIEPEDDIRDTNPPTNPELLAALEKHFIDSKYDLRELIRAIVSSNTYQLSSVPSQANLADQQNYSRYYPRRLQAEVLLDSIDDLVGTRTDFPNLPPGTRAIALPDNSYNNASPFLKVFGRPSNESVCECERIQSSSLAQSLHLMNAADIKNKLGAAGGRAERLAKSTDPLDQSIVELYLAAFARKPRTEELNIAVDYLNQPRLDKDGKPIDPTKTKQENFKDLLWALINSKEFLFNH